MAASLGPSWSLRSGASPRCLTAYVAVADSDAPRHVGGAVAAGGGGSTIASNPFDDDEDVDYDDDDDDDEDAVVAHRRRGGHHNAGDVDAGGDAGGCVCSVAFGTERGSLHYRRYPAGERVADPDDGGGGGGRRSGGMAGGYHPDHRDRGSSCAVVEPDPTPGGQVDLQGAVKGSVVGIVRAAAASASSSREVTTTTPVFLLLVDDGRGSSSAQSSNPGAYAAHLVAIRHGAFGKLPPAPPVDDGAAGSSSSSSSSPDRPPLGSQDHRRGGGIHHGSGGGGGGGGWFGGGEGTPRPGGGDANSRGAALASPGALPPSAATAPPGGQQPQQQQQAIGPLPRMSCVAYHPNAGFVYAAGTGVRGLPTPAARAVSAAAMADGDGSSGGGGAGRGGPSSFHSSGGGASVSSASHSGRPRHSSAGGKIITTAFSPPSVVPPRPPTALYLRCGRALPPPGARGGSGGGSPMALACAGRAAIVAAGNAFYAVPCCLDVGAMMGRPRSSSSASSSSSLPNVVPASKILTFAQSSQVHPVIVVEVATTSGGGAVAPPANPAGRPRPVSSVLFLASGRECATLEVTSIPNNNNPSTATTAPGRGGGGGDVGVPAGGGGIVSTSVRSSAPRHGMATLPSPILAAAALPPSSSGGGGDPSSSGPLVALLTADGLAHLRSPSCVAVPLASIEVGTRPGDFFALAALVPPGGFGGGAGRSSRRTRLWGGRDVVAASYGGEARVVRVRPESTQDFADRLMKLCIDAFGANGFPRLELAEALGATFSATSYGGSGGMEPTRPAGKRRGLLRQYLESVLGLADGNAGSAVSTVMSDDGQESGLEIDGGRLAGYANGVGGADAADDYDAALSPPPQSLGANPLLTCTALLCLVCYQLSPPNGAAACRASKSCASNMGVVRPKDSGISKAATAVCELVADRLLKEVSTSFSLLTSTSSSAPITSSGHGRPSPGSCSMEFVESAVWLLRSCGCHEKAIDVLRERMSSPAFRNATVGGGGGGSLAPAAASSWSQIKFDSYLATHLGELWSSGDDQCRQLVLLSPATKDLLARDPTLGLSVLATAHPQNEAEWRKMRPGDDPLAHPLYPTKVVELLKSVTPRRHRTFGGAPHELDTAESFSSFSPRSGRAPAGPMPIDSGRALAVSYLESAIGIATGRPASHRSGGNGSPSFRDESWDEIDERKADMHDELSYLLLEGVISERGDEDRGEDSDLGALYRFKLRRLLSWPGSMIRSERLLGSLPSSFMREHALLLGRLGRHEDALRILYSQERSLELALEYCDVRHERRIAQVEDARARGGDAVKSLPLNECAYIPLVKVALSSDPDSDRGTAAAIQVLSLRRDSIDRAAALRLLPKNIPMSLVARPFLIPAVVENESQVRRLTVASSLLRSRYIQLKQKLTEAQLKSQSTLHSALKLKGLNLGEPLHSSKPTKARPVHGASPHYPDVMLVKHFFPRHLVIQAQVMNSNNSATTYQQINAARTLADVAFVIAESSDEALVPTLELPLKTVPPGATGSVWCILAASPQRLDGAAYLTCELRFSALEVDAATGTPLNFGEVRTDPVVGNSGFGQTYVEELQDIEVRHTEFG